MSTVEHIGTMALPEGGRVDFARLRRERRQRLFEAMAGAAVDVLILGRPANVAFASGARQLWTSGTRPFGPACVVVAATGRVHLLSTWDEGVPAEIPHRDLIGLTWNPAVLMARLRSIEGLHGAARVATDGWGPGSAELLSALCPDATVIDGGRLLHQARAVKSPDELTCLTTAAVVAEAALTALSDGLRPGVTERQLVGLYAEAVAGAGLPCPPTEGVAWVSTDGHRPRRVVTDRPLRAGDLVALNPGAIYAGYEVTVGRTRVVGGADERPGDSHAALEVRAALDAVIAVCRPGATGAELLEAWDRYGRTPLVEPLAWGLGLGVEQPVIGPGGLGANAHIRAGAVLAVQAWSVRDRVGGILEQDVIVVDPDGPIRITRSHPGLLVV
jgi:Xaa-Pro aminopeptidase